MQFLLMIYFTYIITDELFTVIWLYIIRKGRQVIWLHMKLDGFSRKFSICNNQALAK